MDQSHKFDQPKAKFLEEKERPNKLQERRMEKRFGCKRRPASGAFPMLKGDNEGKMVLVDCKSTVHDSIRITKEQLKKITTEAYAERKRPAIAITFSETDVGVAKDWVLVEAELVKEAGIL